MLDPAYRDVEFLSPKRAARYLDTSVSTLAKLRIYGGGPAFSKIGRVVRYSKADLDAFMATTRQASTFSATGKDTDGN